MDEFELFSLRFKNSKLELLDQRQLPDVEDWLECSDPMVMWKLINQLSVRGAPMIGVAAAMCLATVAIKENDAEKVKSMSEYLKTSRPTAVNLAFCCDAINEAIDKADKFTSDIVVKKAFELKQREIEMNDQMASRGADLVVRGENILTHCNTGSLATPGCGTALGVIRHAHRRGRAIHVYVDETRPLLQGGRLTTYELGREKIPYTLITDSMAATLMRDGKVDRVLVGADRIARNGDFANKIGTYSLAVLAKHHNVPFHAVAPLSTVDLDCTGGDQIPIEQREPTEVQGVPQHRWAPADAQCYNPAFDVTPADLVTSFILDVGVFTPQQIADAPNGLADLLSASAPSK